LLKKAIGKAKMFTRRWVGRTDAGRYLIVFFVRKKTQQALILSARDMTRSERRRYEKK
jgi:uncharacterized DUF497 family protein